jgi:serine/threonine protein kinase
MPSKSQTPPQLDNALYAIADGTPVPWQDLEADIADPAQIEVLRLLDDVAQAYRTEENPPPAATRAVMFRWGGLDVEALIGSGSYGEVYRAFDPWLGRHVALKLLCGSTNNGSGLDEARRLARLRHRNVLNVYGCAVHDGRAGLWSELIDGRTLADAVASDGAFSAEEAQRVGRNLAQALASVHAAGLVHADIKAENVMRESGGRVVLMDFGAGGDQRLLVERRLISGTPRYLPPEVLDGAALSIQSDVYALGVLLFFLLSARHPYAETEAAALRQAQRRGEIAALATLRPDLDRHLCTLIDHCVAADPARRPSSAMALDARLADLQHAQAGKAARRLPIAAMVIALGAMIAAAATLAWPRLFPPPWESDLRFLHVEPAGDVELAANSTLRVGDRLRMSLRSTRDSYLYVLNEDASGNANVLFPLASDNPLHAGVTRLLPGGEAQAWEVTADSAREEFVVVAALHPLPELDGELANWRRASSTDTTRAVGAVVDAPGPLLRGEHLRAILAHLKNDPAHIHVWQYSFAHRN